ncbi:MAG: hypothetical protein GY938_32810, partial [Ketobacter sp.]|nr:hypothetical protein [Ketobacter sp.]
MAKQSPILMSGPMVMAIFDKRKTMTRRVLQRQPPSWLSFLGLYAPGQTAVFQDTRFTERKDFTSKLQYQVGDMLWIKETWQRGWVNNQYMGGPGIRYKEGNQSRAFVHPDCQWQCPDKKWRPSIFMPKWASRLTLKVTGVKVELLQDISEQDAIAEGLEWYDDENRPDRDSGWQCYPKPSPGEIGLSDPDPRKAFETLWQSINATRKGGVYSWSENPWVAAYTF